MIITLSVANKALSLNVCLIINPNADLTLTIDNNVGYRKVAKIDIVTAGNNHL